MILNRSHSVFYPDNSNGRIDVVILVEHFMETSKTLVNIVHLLSGESNIVIKWYIRIHDGFGVCQDAVFDGECVFANLHFLVHHLGLVGDVEAEAECEENTNQHQDEEAVVGACQDVDNRIVVDDFDLERKKVNYVICYLKWEG